MTPLLNFPSNFSQKFRHRDENEQCLFKTLPKAQRTRGLSSAYQSNLMGQTLKPHLQNIDQAST